MVQNNCCTSKYIRNCTQEFFKKKARLGYMNQLSSQCIEVLDLLASHYMKLGPGLYFDLGRASWLHWWGLAEALLASGGDRLTWLCSCRLA